MLLIDLNTMCSHLLGTRVAWCDLVQWRRIAHDSDSVSFHQLHEGHTNKCISPTNANEVDAMSSKAHALLCNTTR